MSLLSQLLTFKDKQYLLEIQNETLKIGMTSVIPYAMPCLEFGVITQRNVEACNGSPGLSFETSTSVCALLGLKCKFYMENHKEFGGNSTGNWTGLLRYDLLYISNLFPFLSLH